MLGESLVHDRTKAMAMGERAGSVDETTMKFGLLMESAQAHQKMAETHLEKLRAHTQDLDGVVREEIRRTLVEELDELTAESRRAAQALKGMKRAAHLRVLVLSVSTVLLSAAIPGALAYWLLPSPTQIEALRARRDELQTSLARLEQHGARIDWRHCGERARLCVRVDRSAPSYGDKADYFVVEGYWAMDWVFAIFDRDAVPIAASIALGIVVFVRVLNGRPGEVHKRGVRIRDGAAARRGARRAARWPREGARAEQLSFAGIPVRLRDETKHFKVLGTTGTGKSTAIGELLASALERGDRAVFADPDGGYRSRFFDRYRGDVVLNPFEADSLKWDPFAEIRNAYDIEQLAGSLIPDTQDRTAGEWRGYARTLLGAVLRGCRSSNRSDCAELWRLMSEASPEELRCVVAGTPAQPFLDPENARMFGSIRSVAVSALVALQHVARQRAAPFSVSRWVSGSSAGSLFIPYRAGQIQALKSIIATWMRLAIFAAMHGEAGADQRLWFVVDELDALGAIDGLKDALARLRKFGGRCCLGFHSVAQVTNTYGGDAQPIVENCGNTLILRCSASEHGGTSQFASRLIGEREVLRRQISRGSDREGLFARRGARRSKNTSEQRVTEAAVMSSEIEGLPDFCGYLKVASASEWLKVSFERSRSSDRSDMHGRLRLESKHQRSFK